MAYKHMGKILPGRIRKGYGNLLKYCDIAVDPDKFIGFVLLFGLGVAFAIAINLMIIFSLTFDTFLFTFIFSYIIFELIVYMWLVLRADAKGKFVENILPDVLLLMSMNIRSGMTTDRALIMTARPEFGPLEKELNRAGKQILAGKEIKYALLEMAYRIKSKQLERTIRLIIEGIESGGELSSLLRQTAEELQSTRLVQNEVHASVLMYAIFIFFAAGIGAPLLFGISTYLVGTIGQQFSTFTITGLSQQPVMGKIEISPEFLTTFALLSLTITSFFGGLIIGIVKSGYEKAGVKLIPILLVISFFVFFAVRIVISNIFPGLSPVG